MTYVLDACAMIAYLRAEPGGMVVRDILADTRNYCVAHAVNLCEVYYDFLRRHGRRAARGAMRDLSRSRVRTRRDMSSSFWTSISDLKGTQKVSLADCFAIELANRVAGQ